MKTLSEAVQVAIISEAGSTYRNFILGAMRDTSYLDYPEIMAAAKEVASGFVESMTAKITSTTNYTVVNQVSSNIDSVAICEKIKNTLRDIGKS